MANILPEAWVDPAEMSKTLKEQNDRAQARLMYWSRLRGARQEYIDETETHWGSGSHIKFTEWMDNKYGVRLEFIDGNISGAYTITNQRKLTMFLLKYPG